LLFQLGALAVFLHRFSNGSGRQLSRHRVSVVTYAHALTELALFATWHNLNAFVFLRNAVINAINNRHLLSNLRLLLRTLLFLTTTLALSTLFATLLLLLITLLQLLFSQRRTLTARVILTLVTAVILIAWLAGFTRLTGFDAGSRASRGSRPSRLCACSPLRGVRSRRLLLLRRLLRRSPRCCVFSPSAVFASVFSSAGAAAGASPANSFFRPPSRRATKPVLTVAGAATAGLF
jgi:hypothetical protein